MATPREKFQGLLRELFQFDCAELDFGIYRIMNQKRDVIEEFIEKDLLNGTARELTTGALAQESELAQALVEVSAQIKENFGDEALDAEGNLAKEYQATPRGKQYLELRERASSARSSNELESEIFNHLYAFFSRYYDEGDFMSLRRYSRRDKYAIPYNGEEVYLHWANADQYYIKTGENFTDYSYKYGEWTVCFKLRNADVAQNNVKGAKRFFLPRVADVEVDKKKCVLMAPFEYRPLVQDEETRYGSKLTQENILTEAYPRILAAGKAHQDALAALVHEKRKDAEGKPVTLLEHHLWTYARKNTSDFFIHKDLKGFLGRELDFYLKNEVLNIDELEAGGEARSPRWFQMMTTIKAIGRKIIVFLAQIEDFQKKIFEKKKFVTEVNYCITLDRVPEELYPEIIKNKAQIEEWKSLFDIEDKPIKLDFLKSQPHLVLDTKHFNNDFKDNLLASLDSLDAGIDGLIIKSENSQALNFLLERYREQIKCVYIDPPYNTSEETFVYKNLYKHSSWVTMIANKIEMSVLFMNKNSVMQVAIDDEEVYRLKMLLDRIMDEDRYIGTIVVQSNPRGRGINSHFATSHDYYLCYANNPLEAVIVDQPLTEEQEQEYALNDTDSTYRLLPFRRSGGLSTPDERPNSEFSIYYSSSAKKIIGIGGPRVSPYPKEYKPEHVLIINDDGSISKEAPGHIEKLKHLEVIMPVDTDGGRRVWRWSDRKKILNAVQRGDFAVSENKGRYSVQLKDRIKDGRKPKTIWSDSKYDASSHGTNLLQEILGSRRLFGYPKSIFSTVDALHCVLGESTDAVCLDYFAGSGTTAHAVINLNRADGGKRKYILVEVGEYFDTVLKPRIQKIIYSKDWQDGKPVSRQGSSHAFKYLRLESYEDALDNISFQTEEKQGMLKLDDYVLSYMLNFETKQSETFLNVAKLDTPFDYKLKRHGKDKPLPVDLPETFNYLIGLHVDSRRVLENKGNRYLVYRGKAEGRQTVILWRTTSGWGQKEFEQDRDFVLKEKLTEGVEDVFVNTDSFISGARSLDPVFKHRMFNEA